MQRKFPVKGVRYHGGGYKSDAAGRNLSHDTALGLADTISHVYHKEVRLHIQRNNLWTVMYRDPPRGVRTARGRMAPTSHTRSGNQDEYRFGGDPGELMGQPHIIETRRRRTK